MGFQVLSIPSPPSLQFPPLTSPPTINVMILLYKFIFAKLLQKLQRIFSPSGDRSREANVIIKSEQFETLNFKRKIDAYQICCTVDVYKVFTTSLTQGQNINTVFGNQTPNPLFGGCYSWSSYVQLKNIVKFLVNKAC